MSDEEWREASFKDPSDESVSVYISTGGVSVIYKGGDFTPPDLQPHNICGEEEFPSSFFDDESAVQDLANRALAEHWKIENSN
jgi:hypothetical protein